MLCLLGHLGRSGDRGRRQRQRTRANWSRRGGDIVGRFSGSAELIVQVLRRFVPDMQDLFAQLERQLGEGDVGQRRDPAYHQGQRVHRWRQRPGPTVPASWSRPCAAPILRGMEILAGIRLDELRTLCDACLLRLQAMFGDVHGVGELNRRGGQSRQGFRRTGLACIRCGSACKRSAMDVIRRYS